MRLSRVVIVLVLLAAVAVAVIAIVGDSTSNRATGDGGTPVPTASPEPTPLVNPDDIVSGGPPPDGIPPIDEPRFVAAADVTFLEPQEPVIWLDLEGDVKAYPLRILMWHEIVNDDVGGVPVSVTYCPLCNTGIVFHRPVIDGELLDFGTSGKLYHSNLVMYDRQTESLWPQATGQAVIGPLTGTQLEFLPSQIVAWSDFVEAHPGGVVLSQRTGHQRPYGENPYVGYDDQSTPFLYTGDVDPRLPAKARVLGVAVGDERVAFPYRELRNRAEGDWAAVEAKVGGERVVVLWKQGAVSALDERVIPDSNEVGAVGAFRPFAGERQLSLEARSGGVFDRETGSRWDILGRAVAGPLSGSELERVEAATDSYWFDWAAFFPSTEVFGQ